MEGHERHGRGGRVRGMGFIVKEAASVLTADSAAHGRHRRAN